MIPKGFIGKQEPTSAEPQLCREKVAFRSPRRPPLCRNAFRYPGQNFPNGDLRKNDQGIVAIEVVLMRQRPRARGYFYAAVLFYNGLVTNWKYDGRYGMSVSVNTERENYGAFDC